jgi:hypothetical protein
MNAKEVVTKEVSVHFNPCITCGGDDISYGDCGYSSFNVARATCNTCGKIVEISPCSCFIKTSEIAKHWNKKNDIEKRYLL